MADPNSLTTSLFTNSSTFSTVFVATTSSSTYPNYPCLDIAYYIANINGTCLGWGDPRCGEPAYSSAHINDTCQTSGVPPTITTGGPKTGAGGSDSVVGMGGKYQPGPPSRNLALTLGAPDFSRKEIIGISVGTAVAVITLLSM
jgi:hypothetical protein